MTLATAATIIAGHDHVSGAHACFALNSGMQHNGISVTNAPPVAALVSALVCVGLVPAQAQQSSAWQKEAHAATRLLAGATVKTDEATFVRAGVEIRLEDGWETYWRYPGDTGVPPTFNFTGSGNVKSVVVDWPAPERFSDGAGGNSIGYRGDVVLPLRVTPADPGYPVSLDLKLDYAVCGNLCVPAQAMLHLNLTGNGPEEAALENAETHVPKREALGGQAGGLKILSVRRERGGEHDRVVVDVAAPPGAPVALFAEGPAPDWMLPLPEPDGPATGATRRFSFVLDGLPAGAKADGATLLLTAVCGEDAIEVPARLD